MIHGKENLYNWIRSNDAPYWTVRNYSNTAQQFGQSEYSNDNLTVEKSIEDLENLFSTLAYSGRYNIQIKKKSDSAKSGVSISSFEFTNEDRVNSLTNTDVHQIMQQPVISGFDKSYVDEKLDSALKQQKLEFDILNLKRELRESKEQKANAFEPLISKIGSIAEMVVEQYLTKSTTPIAAIAKVSSTEDIEIIEQKTETTENMNDTIEFSEQDTKKIEDAITKIFKACSVEGVEAPEFFEKIGNKLEKKPKLINTVLGFL